MDNIYDAVEDLKEQLDDIRKAVEDGEGREVVRPLIAEADAQLKAIKSAT